MLFLWAFNTTDEIMRISRHPRVKSTISRAGHTPQKLCMLIESDRLWSEYTWITTQSNLHGQHKNSTPYAIVIWTMRCKSVIHHVTTVHNAYMSLLLHSYGIAQYCSDSDDISLLQLPQFALSHRFQLINIAENTGNRAAFLWLGLTIAMYINVNDTGVRHDMKPSPHQVLPGRSSKLTHTDVEIDTCAFQTGCQLSSAASGMSLELRFLTQFQWREAYVLDNWQLAELPQSGGREFDPRRVHDNLSVPLWVYMRFPVPEHQN